MITGGSTVVEGFQRVGPALEGQDAVIEAEEVVERAEHLGLVIDDQQRRA